MISSSGPSPEPRPDGISAEPEGIGGLIEAWASTEQGQRALDEIFGPEEAAPATPPYCGDPGCWVCLERGLVPPEEGRRRGE